MNRQQAAHLRMLETLPKRTHYAKERKKVRKSYTPPREDHVTDEMKAEMKRLDGLRWKRKDIALQVGVCQTTVFNHLGPKKKRG